jgi:hypothetical protein
MNVQHISSAPSYITKFISGNMEQLNKIYEEGLMNNRDGILACKCSEKDNRMDIQFMNEEMILEMITKEKWEPYKKTIPEDKKLMYVMDLDLNSIFLVTI